MRLSALRERGGSLSVDSDWRSADGRLVALRVQWGGYTLNVASLYAPTDRSAQPAFFSMAVAQLKQRPGLPADGRPSGVATSTLSRTPVLTTHQPAKRLPSARWQQPGSSSSSSAATACSCSTASGTATPAVPVTAISAPSVPLA